MVVKTTNKYKQDQRCSKCGEVAELIDDARTLRLAACSAGNTNCRNRFTQIDSEN